MARVVRVPALLIVLGILALTGVGLVIVGTAGIGRPGFSPTEGVRAAGTPTPGGGSPINASAGARANQPSPTPSPLLPTPALAASTPSPGSFPTVIPVTAVIPTATAEPWIRLSPDTGPPGTIVQIEGYDPNPPPTPSANGQIPTDHVNACWGDCQDGLHEEALERTWSAGAPGHFTVRFVVPAAPWLTAAGPHPLAPGDYTVGVACFGPASLATKGPGYVPCGRQPARATATFYLTGPASPHCQTAPCARLTLSPDHGPPGTEVQVGGWAPLNEIVGDRPFVYDLVVETPGARADAPFHIGYAQQDLDGSIRGSARLPLAVGAAGPLTPGPWTLALQAIIPTRANAAVPTSSAEIAMTQLGPAPALSLRVLLAPLAFAVSAAPDWASLGPLHPLAIQPSASAPAIAVDPSNPRRLAYCGSDGIQVSANDGQRWSTVPTGGAVQAAAGSPYQFQPTTTTSPPICGTLAVDPIHPGSFYAAFGMIRTEYHSAPPYFAIAFVTADAGRTWRLVPPPSGLDLSTFGGFQVGDHAVLAVFSSPTQTLPAPSFAVQATFDGGKTWASGQLPCPAAGPCVRFGAADLVVTGMGAMLPQSIERSTDSGRSWFPPSWPSSVVTRYGSNQLVALGPTTIALISSGPGDPSYPFLLSTDGGATWEVVALPTVPGSALDPPHLPTALTMLPDGSLLGWNNTPPSGAGYWDLLQPGAAAWCRAADAALPGAWGSMAPFRVIGDRLWWIDGSDPTLVPLRIESLAISALSCGPREG
jgi:hypothetical protein